MHYKIETLNPCNCCPAPSCGLLDGQECERLNTFRHVKATLAKTIKELQITRDYIHDCNLEWDLLSYIERRKHREQL